MAIFGEGLLILGMPMRTVGLVLLALGLGESYLYAALARRRERQFMAAAAEIEQRFKALAFADKATVSGILETVGRWDGPAEAVAEGIFIEAEHVWWTGEDGEEHREQDDTVLPWRLFESATLDEGVLVLRPVKPSMLFQITIEEFENNDPEPWLKLLAENGVQVERETPTN